MLATLSGWVNLTFRTFEQRQAAQEFPDLTRAGDLGLERSRRVAVRRFAVGALRQLRIGAVEFGGFDIPPGCVRPCCR